MPPSHGGGGGATGGAYQAAKAPGHEKRSKAATTAREPPRPAPAAAGEPKRGSEQSSCTMLPTLPDSRVAREVAEARESLDRRHDSTGQNLVAGSCLSDILRLTSDE